MMAYTIQEQQGCRIVTGPVPISDMVALMEAWCGHADPDDIDPADTWIIDADLSQRLGATMVCGPRHAMDALRAALATGVSGHE